MKCRWGNSLLLKLTVKNSSFCPSTTCFTANEMTQVLKLFVTFLALLTKAYQSLIINSTKKVVSCHPSRPSHILAMMPVAPVIPVNLLIPVITVILVVPILPKHPSILRPVSPVSSKFGYSSRHSHPTHPSHPGHP